MSLKKNLYIVFIVCCFILGCHPKLAELQKIPSNLLLADFATKIDTSRWLIVENATLSFRMPQKYSRNMKSRWIDFSGWDEKVWTKSRSEFSYVVQDLKHFTGPIDTSYFNDKDANDVNQYSEHKETINGHEIIFVTTRQIKGSHCSTVGTSSYLIGAIIPKIDQNYSLAFYGCSYDYQDALEMLAIFRSIRIDQTQSLKMTYFGNPHYYKPTFTKKWF